MLDRLYEIVFFISAFLFLLFAFFLFAQKKGHRLSNIIFAWFCLSLAVYTIQDLFDIFRHSVYKIFPVYSDVILESTFFLMGPLLYFYARSLIQKNFILRRTHLWHLTPFLLDLVYRNIRYFGQSNAAGAILERAYFVTRLELRGRYLAMDLHVILYVTASLIILHGYRLQIKDFFSSIEKIRLSWLSLVLFGFYPVRLFHLAKLTIASLGETWRDLFGLGTHLGTTVLATVVVYKGLIQPEIFAGLEGKTNKQKYAKTSLPEDKMRVYQEKLVRHMEIEKPYLNPDLSLDDVAHELSIPSHYLSQVLNRGLHQNFYYFVNRYRVEESKRLLTEITDHQKTVLEVLYEAGFNSKSAFNHVFRQYTGMTPTEFIHSQRKN